MIEVGKILEFHNGQRYVVTSVCNYNNKEYYAITSLSRKYEIKIYHINYDEGYNKFEELKSAGSEINILIEKLLDSINRTVNYIENK